MVVDALAAAGGAARLLPPLTLSRALTSWSWDVPALATLLAAGGWYERAAWRARRSEQGWPRWREVAFVAGLLLLAAATCGAVGVYAHALIWVFTVQLCLLLVVAPLLLAAGHPLALLRRDPRGDRGRWLHRVADAPATRVLGAPGVGPLLLIGVTTAVYFTPAGPWAMRSAAGWQLLHAALLAAGLLLALPVVDRGIRLSSAAYGLMLALGFVEFLLDAVPGIVLRLDTHVLGSGYWSLAHPLWSGSLLADQQHAGAWLWFFAEAGDVPLLAAIVVAWMRADAREAHLVDAALDRAAASVATGGAGSSGRPATPQAATPVGEQATGELTRPWWESDPSVFGAERSARYGWRPQDRQPPAPPG